MKQQAKSKLLTKIAGCRTVPNRTFVRVPRERIHMRITDVAMTFDADRVRDLRKRFADVAGICVRESFHRRPCSLPGTKWARFGHEPGTEPDSCTWAGLLEQQKTP